MHVRTDQEFEQQLATWKTELAQYIDDRLAKLDFPAIMTLIGGEEAWLKLYRQAHTVPNATAVPPHRV